MGLSTKELSLQKKQLSQLINRIDQLAFQCAHPDPLIQGTPGEVLKRCGRKNCKCAINPAQRHGPYPVIQVYQNNKQRQIFLRKNQKQLWEQAKNYQKQTATLLTLKKTCIELTDLVEKLIMNRVEKWP